MNALVIENLRYAYPSAGGNITSRPVIEGLQFSVDKGEIFGLLGPNGGGKTTLFRILSTLAQPSAGTVRILDHDLTQKADLVRSRIGVVFQNPSLDKKLTVRENLLHQGRLYGLSGAPLNMRIADLLDRFHLTERANDRVEILSGGLARRTEIVKGLLHKPELLLMDEPSTGLDPAARRDLWDVLSRLKSEGITILLTTHLMEEAEKCDRVAILNRGKLVALGTPSELKRTIAADVISIHTDNPDFVKEKLAERFETTPILLDGTVRMEIANGHKAIPTIVEFLPGSIAAISVGKPTLEDVFIQRTGRGFEENS